MTCKLIYEEIVPEFYHHGDFGFNISNQCTHRALTQGFDRNRPMRARPDNIFRPLHLQFIVRLQLSYMTPYWWEGMKWAFDKHPVWSRNSFTVIGSMPLDRRYQHFWSSSPLIRYRNVDTEIAECLQVLLDEAPSLRGLKLTALLWENIHEPDFVPSDAPGKLVTNALQKLLPRLRHFKYVTWAKESYTDQATQHDCHLESFPNITTAFPHYTWQIHRIKHWPDLRLHPSQYSDAYNFAKDPSPKTMRISDGSWYSAWSFTVEKTHEAGTYVPPQGWRASPMAKTLQLWLQYYAGGNDWEWTARTAIARSFYIITETPQSLRDGFASLLDGDGKALGYG